MNLVKEIASIKDHTYVRIPNDCVKGVYSYGGSQNWYAKRGGRIFDYTLHNYGCGAVALYDFFLYYAKMRGVEGTGLLRKAAESDYQPDKKSYLAVLRKVNLLFCQVIPFGGMNGVYLAFAFDRFIHHHDLKIFGYWKVTIGRKRFVKQVKKQLDKDLPVIMSVGPNTPMIWSKKGISFYRIKSDGTVGGVAYHDVNRHFFTVTGLIKQEETEYFVISSWGKKYYVKVDEYLDYRGKRGDIITSSFLKVIESK